MVLSVIEPVILRDERIMVRPYESMDIDAHFEAAVESVDDVFPWLVWCHPGYTRRESRIWVETRDREWKAGISYDFCITDARDGTFLGGCAVNNIQPDNRFANLGYWVRSSRTRQGIATAAAGLILPFGFGTLGLNRIEIVTAVGNEPSRRVAEKLGALCEGVLRNRVVTAKGVSDAVMFSLIGEDGEKMKA